MSRFSDDCDYDYDYNNQAELWHANLKRALAGKRGKKALAEMRDALMALPEHRLIEGALCTVGGADRPDAQKHDDPRGWYREDITRKLEAEGEGVCAIGAFLWFKQVKAGADPRAAFDALPTLLDSDGDGDMATAEAGREAGLAMTLAWHLAWKNDGDFEGMTPEERHAAYVAWIDEQLAVAA